MPKIFCGPTRGPQERSGPRFIEPPRLNPRFLRRWYRVMSSTSELNALCRRAAAVLSSRDTRQFSADQSDPPQHSLPPRSSPPPPPPLHRALLGSCDLLQL